MKLAPSKFPEIRAQSRSPLKPRIYPQYSPKQSRQTALIAAYTCFNRRNFRPEHEFQSIPERNGRKTV
jgi:hypothetical protein